MHTPGPWTAENHPECVSQRMLDKFGADTPAWFVMAGVSTVASINGPAHLRPIEYLEADACLIAAAPEMLALLRQIVEPADEIRRLTLRNEARTLLSKLEAT